MKTAKQINDPQTGCVDVKTELSKVGIPPAMFDEVLVEVKANSAKLATCPRHDFSICLDRRTKEPINNPTPAQRFGAYWSCSRCGGYVEGIHRTWYERGLKDSSHQ